VVLALGPGVQSMQAQEAVRPRIGLVLSGGGARGIAHVGLLKTLDSLAIPIDYIAGTSMGSIVGALYAVGHSGKEIERTIRAQNWPDLFSDQPPRHRLPYPEKKRHGRYQLRFGFDGRRFQAPSGLIQGQNIRLKLGELVSPYDAVGHFDDLPIPFRCIAADLNSCDPITLESGNLAKAVRASMSIPTAFAPVSWGDYHFIDGGMLNNFPVDAVKAMGANRIIGMDVMGVHRDPEPPRTIVQVLNRTLGFLGVQQWRQNVADTDIYIAPDLEGYSIMDFTDRRIAGIVACGDRAASAYRDSLLALKSRYRLHRYTRPEPGVKFKVSRLRLHGLHVMSHSDFRERLSMEPGTAFTLAWLHQRLNIISVGMPIDTIAWEVIPDNATHAEVRIRIRESVQPIIEGVEVTGQEIMPFGTIYRQLGIQPGETLDLAKLSQRIMDLYGLGYFENIDYDLLPTQPGYVRLKLRVKEKPRRQISVGASFDSHYKLIVGFGGVATNFPLPGLRIEEDLKLAGKTEMNLKVYYPSRTLNLPIYPLMHFSFHHYPIAIYDDKSNKLAEYQDKAAFMAYGLGIQLGRNFNLTACYKVSWVDVEPEVAMPDPLIFPSWKHRLKEVAVQFDYDCLDDAIAPRHGFVFRGSFDGNYNFLDSDLSYQRFAAEVDAYFTLGLHTLRAHVFAAGSSKRTPVYRGFNRGQPQFFIGMQADQIFAPDLKVWRAEYQLWLKPFLALKAMANVATDYRVHYPSGEFGIRNLWGFGAAFHAVTPLGIMEAGMGRGDKHWSGDRAWQTVGFLRIGTLL